MDEAHRLLDQKTAAVVAGRQTFWQRDLSSPEAYAKSVAPNRERLKKILGVVDARVPAVLERYGDDDNPSLVAETEAYRVWQVRWSVLPGVTGEGLLAEPKSAPVAHVVAVPDADHTPEQLLGLSPGIPAASQFARVLAASGFRVLVPAADQPRERFLRQSAGADDEPAAPRMDLSPSVSTGPARDRLRNPEGALRGRLAANHGRGPSDDWLGGLRRGRD